MAIRVVTVSPPAVGTDWRYTIPGQWLARLVGVSARLTTTANPLQVVDVSGNGHNGNVNPTWSGTFGNPGPFAGGANNLCPVNADATNAPAHALGASTPQNAFWSYGAPLALDYWARDDVINNSGANRCITARQTLATNVGNSDYQWSDFTGGGDPWDLRFTLGGTGQFTVANVVAVGTWVHVGHTWDGVNWTTFKNGVLINTHAGAPPGVTAAPSIHVFGGGNQSCPWVGAIAGVAHYNANLVAANYAAHAAANATAAAYQAAVLADAPKGLWMLNELQSKTSRQSNLVITDGTTTVATFPAGFSVTNAGEFDWSWQVLGPGAAQSVDGSTATVNIPEMTLDAGYTIGTRTLDIVSTDQWSAITLWFDDGTGSGTGTPGESKVPYLDALVVPYGTEF